MPHLLCVGTICNGGSIMHNGTVKWFNPTKGFGFIQPDIGENDVFIHKTVVVSAGISDLVEGQKVTFETQVADDGKVSVSSLNLAD